MKTPWVLATLWLGTSLPAFGVQAATPEAALEEIATADKPEAIVRHLPEPVQKSIDELPKLQKRQVLDKLLSMKSEQPTGVRCAAPPMPTHGNLWTMMARARARSRS